MKKYNSHSICGFAVVSLVGCLAAQAAELSGSRPNIILVLVDDVGWGEMGASGNKILKTPNIDRIYNEGTRFTNFHVAPNCAPTRAQLMTGNHNFRSGVIDPKRPEHYMQPDAITVAQRMKAARYHTAMIGKWHLGGHLKPSKVRDDSAYQPYNRGFDVSLMASHSPSMNVEFYRNGVMERSKGYREDVLFDQAMKWIRSVKDSDRPFFCYLATYAPHLPLEAPEKWVRPYEGKGLKDWGSTGRIWGRLWGAGYYGAIANVDWNIGRLLEFMETEGLEKNTVIMYMSDNGHSMTGQNVPGQSRSRKLLESGMYNMGMKGGKGTSYRGGTCVPWIVRWPGKIAANRAIDTLAGGIDFFPTVLDLAGGTVEHKIDGMSVVPLLEDDTATLPERAIYVNKGFCNPGNLQAHERTRYSNMAVQTQRYRLVHGDKRWGGGFELYDHRTDPGETNNIIKEHPELADRLKRMYDQWYDEMVPTLYNDGVRANIKDRDARKSI